MPFIGPEQRYSYIGNTVDRELKTSMNDLSKHGLIYLATPFTNYHLGHGAAFIEAARIAGKLMSMGADVYSPIAHGWPCAEYGRMDHTDHDLWERINAPHIKRADTLFIAIMDGWRESRGVGDEVDAFLLARKPIYLIDPYALVPVGYNSVLNRAILKNWKA